MQRLVVACATFFSVGKLPVAPGTWGSLCGVIIYLLVQKVELLYMGSTAILLVIGFSVCGKAEKFLKEKDPHSVVIDEVGAMMLCFLFIPFSLVNVFVGFFVFRFFDIVKPYPANKLQNLKGSAGIMLDDVVAAIYTNLALRAVSLLF